MPAGFTAVEALASDHDLEGFDCGSQALNHWLLTWARHGQRVDAVRTFVICEAGTGRVVGFHALVAATAGQDEAPRKLARAASPHVVPVVLLARLAVRTDFTGRRLGAVLLRDAMLRTAQAADHVGAVALMVHAKDDEARGFYEHFGFLPSPLQPLQLFLPLATIRRAIGAAGA